MNVYGKVMTDTKRQANSKVVQMVLREPKPALRTAENGCGGLMGAGRL